MEKSDDHHNHNHHPLFQTIKIDSVPTIDRASFENWLSSLSDQVIRSKGIIQLAETPGFYQFQYASKQLQLTRLLDNQLSPCIILIGHDLPVVQIKETFEKIG